MVWDRLRQDSHGAIIYKLFENSPEPALILMEGRFVECNQSAVDVMGGSTKGDLLNRTPADLSPLTQPDGLYSSAKADAILNRVMSVGTSQFTWVHNRLDGTPISVRVNLLLLETDIGEIIYTTWHQIVSCFSNAVTPYNHLQKSSLDLLHLECIGGMTVSVSESINHSPITAINTHAKDLLGIEQENTPELLSDVIRGHDGSITELYQHIESTYDDGERRGAIVKIERHFTKWLDVAIYKTSASEVALTLKDVTERLEKRIETNLFRAIYKKCSEATVITDSNNAIVSVNKAFEALTEYEEHEVIGKNPRILASGKTPFTTYNEMWGSLKRNGAWSGELWDQSKSGRVYPKWISINTIKDEQGDVLYHVATFSDISDKKHSEEKINFLAFHDHLTSLPNRFSFEDRVTSLISDSYSTLTKIAVLFIDLDRFKDINDSLGHQVGDEILKGVAERLRNSVRENDVVARLGGDEFIVALNHVGTHEQIEQKAQRVLDNISKQLSVNKQLFHVTPSIGISIFPDDGSTVEDLMKYADAAMYHAKAKGRKNYQFYSSSLSESTSQRLKLIQELYRAFDHNEFQLFYQPQFTSIDGGLCGFEALLRWFHPERGLISPNDFIPLLEESGMIQKVGAWIIDEACRQLAQWQSKGAGSITISVNISASQLQSDTFIDQVKIPLRKYSIPSSSLGIEVTESVAMDNPDLAVSILNEISDLGVNIAIDDFGTGYSSMAYLKKLPINTLKIDREFVKDIGQDSNDEAICFASISLAHNLGLKVVAEGVENKLQHSYLKSHNCDVMQGFLLGKPCPPEEVEILFK